MAAFGLCHHCDLSPSTVCMAPSGTMAANHGKKLLVQFLLFFFFQFLSPYIQSVWCLYQWLYYSVPLGNQEQQQ